MYFAATIPQTAHTSYECSSQIEEKYLRYMNPSYKHLICTMAKLSSSTPASLMRDEWQKGGPEEMTFLRVTLHASYILF